MKGKHGIGFLGRCSDSQGIGQRFNVVVRFFAFLSLLHLLACSSAGPDEAVNPIASDVLLSGGSCSESVTFNEDSELPINDEDNSDFFECGEIAPNTTIDVPAVSGTGNGSISFEQPDEVESAVPASELNQPDIELHAAAVEVFPESAFENHSVIQLYLHDGEFRILEQRFSQQNDDNQTIARHKIDWGIYNGSLALSIELGSAATGGFEGGTFEFVGTSNLNNPQFIGMDVMLIGTVFHDKNDSGVIDAANEIAQVVAGNISIVGNRPNWSIAVDVMLDNNESMIGYFNGDYIEIPIANGMSN